MSHELRKPFHVQKEPVEVPGVLILVVERTRCGAQIALLRMPRKYLPRLYGYNI